MQTTVAQTQAIAEAYPASLDAGVNRISLPLLRIQERKWLLGFVDGTLVSGWMLGAYGAWRLWARPGPHNMAQVPWEWVMGGVAVWLAISWLAGAYELRTADRFRTAARITLSVAMIAVIVAFVAYYTFLKTYPRPALGLAMVGVPTSVLIWRGIYATALRRSADATRLLVVGDDMLHASMVQAATGQEIYYRVLGFLSDRPYTEPGYLGPIDRLGDVAHRLRIHRIVVAPRQSLPTSAVASLTACIERGIEVVDFNAAYEEIAGKVAVEHAGDFWLAALPTRPATSSLEEVSMRLLDIIGAVAGLLLTLVLMPAIAAAITLESGRPIFFSQERVGRGGKTFTMFKFRSMRQDAEAEGAQWATEDDRRTTRVGRFLRRTHLDELPQFWNVLRGEMSLVGPRPERQSFIDQLTEEIPFYRLRLSVRPGLSGLKQIRVGYAATVDEHLEVVRHDLYYIKHRSLALNLLIMWRTLGLVLGMEGR